MITVLVAVLSEYLTGAIEGAAEGFSMSEGLIGSLESRSRTQ